MLMFLGQFCKQTKGQESLFIINKPAFYYVLEMIHSESPCDPSYIYAHNHSTPYVFSRA